ncbi:hypothetical protein ACS0Y7_37160 [Burkholderia gladioli]|uniref:hypothetical protein n=1 Tax=Burkholderia gladioli TaxID=28095 RepID=UPI003F7A22EF
MTELQDRLRAIGNDVTGAISDIAHTYNSGLQALIRRLRSIRQLHAAASDLALAAFMVGIATGLYGSTSTIVEGLTTNYLHALDQCRRDGQRERKWLLRVMFEAGVRRGMNCHSLEDVSRDRLIAHIGNLERR